MATRGYTVLVTACGCPGGPSVVRALAPEFRVIGTDADPAASGRFWCDAFYVTPRGDGFNFVMRLLDICKREGVDVVLPESSSEVMMLARHKPAFEALGITVLVSRPEAVEIALDKAKTYQAIEGIGGIEIPRYRLLDRSQSWVEWWDHFVEAVNALGFPRSPVVLKQPDGKGGRGIRFLVPEVQRMEADLRTWPNALHVELRDVQRWINRNQATGEPMPRLMVMEHLRNYEGAPDTFDGYGGVVGFTKIRRDCREGVHFRHEARVDPELMRQGRAVVQALGLEHFVNVQFMDGMLLEVNPRISTQILHDGFNLPALGVKLALGLVDKAEVRLPDGARAQYFLDLQSYGPDDSGVGMRRERGGCGGGCECDSER